MILRELKLLHEQGKKFKLIAVDIGIGIPKYRIIIKRPRLPDDIMRAGYLSPIREYSANGVAVIARQFEMDITLHYGISNQFDFKRFI